MQKFITLLFLIVVALSLSMPARASVYEHHGHKHHKHHKHHHNQLR
jgi:hypothetical protein